MLPMICLLQELCWGFAGRCNGSAYRPPFPCWWGGMQGTQGFLTVYGSRSLSQANIALPFRLLGLGLKLGLTRGMQALGIR